MNENNTPWSKRLLLIVKVIEVRLRFIAILVAVALLIGYWDTIKNYWDKWTRPAACRGKSAPGRQEFYCPMHPKVIRDGYEPNGDVPKCPICGMPLSLRKKGEKEPLPAGITGRVQLSPERIQLAGIQTVAVAVPAADPADQHGGHGDLRREPPVAGRQPRERLRREALRRQDVHPGQAGRPAGRDLQPRTVQHGPGDAAGRQGQRSATDLADSARAAAEAVRRERPGDRRDLAAGTADAAAGDPLAAEPAT